MNIILTFKLHFINDKDTGHFYVFGMLQINVSFVTEQKTANTGTI